MILYPDIDRSEVAVLFVTPGNFLSGWTMIPILFSAATPFSLFFFFFKTP